MKIINRESNKMWAYIMATLVCDGQKTDCGKNILDLLNEQTKLKEKNQHEKNKHKVHGHADL